MITTMHIAGRGLSVFCGAVDADSTEYPDRATCRACLNKFEADVLQGAYRGRRDRIITHLLKVPTVDRRALVESIMRELNHAK